MDQQPPKKPSKRQSKISILIDSFETMSLPELQIECQNRKLSYDETESWYDLHDRLVASLVTIKPESLKRWQRRHYGSGK